jgi:hypothetical protein
MGYVVLTREVGVDLIDPETGAIKKQNVIVSQGQRLPNNVSDFTINALKASGVIAFAADGPIPAPTVREVEVPMQVRTQDQPPVLPSDPVGNRVIAGEVPIQEAKPASAAVDLGNLDPADVVAFGAGVVAGARTAGADQEESTPDPAEVEKPKVADKKEVWEAYAVSQGMPQAEAESATKTALVEKYS